MQNRVVITGMGIWSCLGITLDEVKESLYNGKSGIILDRKMLAELAVNDKAAFTQLTETAKKALA